MALVLKDRVKETTTTTGTGSYVLAGAVTGFQSFTNALDNGDTTHYAVENGTDWETGLGTWTESTATLARTTIYESSNSGNAVNWGAGSKDIFITKPASRNSTITVYANTINLPSSGSSGDMAFVTATGRLLIYDGTEWKSVQMANATPVLSGANASYTLSTDGTATVVTITATDYENESITYDYEVTGDNIVTVSRTNNVYTITPTTQGSGGSATITFKASDGNSIGTASSDLTLLLAADIEYLVVAGGGGGGYFTGGGGGAGGLLSGTATLGIGVTYTVTVGDGGAGATGNTAKGSNGTNSSFAGSGLTTITAIGGGGGGTHASDATLGIGATGGSGGGGSDRGANTGGSGTSGQGYDGGTGKDAGDSSDAAGGGGGAGGVGGEGFRSDASGDGGAGVQSSITGTATYYAGGGGGGGTPNSSAGAGGSGGGGAGGVASHGDGADATGYGSGGGGGAYSTGSGGAGSDGIVIIKTTSQAASTTGSPTVTTSGSYYIYQFTANGTISW